MTHFKIIPHSCFNLPGNHPKPAECHPELVEGHCQAELIEAHPSCHPEFIEANCHPEPVEGCHPAHQNCHPEPVEG